MIRDEESLQSEEKVKYCTEKRCELNDASFFKNDNQEHEKKGMKGYKKKLKI